MPEKIEINIPDSYRQQQLKPNPSNNYNYTQNGVSIIRSIEAQFLENLREKIPIIDAVFNILTALDGYIEPFGKDKKLVQEIGDWLNYVQVNDLSLGFDAFKQNYCTEALEQGFSYGEFIVDSTVSNIERLVVADSKTIRFARQKNGTLNVFQRVQGDNQDRPLNQNTLMYYAPFFEEQNPYGIPLLRSIDFVVKILQTIQTAMLNAAQRFADPSLLITGTYFNLSKNDLKDKKDELTKLTESFIKAKREGESGEMVFVCNSAPNATDSIKVEVIDVNNKYDFIVPLTHVENQIYSKTGLPPFMFGRDTNAAKEVVTAQMSIVQSGITTRQRLLYPIFKKLINTLLILRGITWKTGDWDIRFQSVNIEDIERIARARFLNAQATQMETAGIQTVLKPAIPLNNEETEGNENVEEVEDTEDTEEDEDIEEDEINKSITKTNKCDCHAAKQINPTGEERPIPWHELDKIEEQYVKELQTEWEKLQANIFYILGLKLVQKQEENPFTVTDEQMKLFDHAVEDFINQYDPKSPKSTKILNWFYEQAFGAGLIQAASSLNSTETAFIVQQNKAILDEFISNGFELLRNRTKIDIGKVTNAMTAGILLGQNPTEIAAVLDKKFGDANLDWNRLARTEMTIAAEEAKKKEYKERKIKELEFVLARDACPQCTPLKGIYKIDESPIPGKDTHPYCRCTLIPV